MTLVSRPYPGLFGGVSQQIPAMRHPTHCTAQLNGIATVVDGLFKRPGTRFHAALPLSFGSLSVAGTYGVVSPHVIDKGAAGMFQLILVSGSLMLYDMATGQAKDVRCPNGFAYLQTANPASSFRCVTVADYTFIVNTSKVAQMKAAPANTQPRNVAYFMVRAAVPKISYTAIVNGSAKVAYSGDTPNVQGVVEQLRQVLSTIPGHTVFVIPNTSIVKVARNDGQPITASATADGWGPTTFQCITEGVEKYSDLPPVFESGFVVAVRGQADASADPYYVEWLNDRWIETRKPGVTVEIDAATMPHQLRPQSDGTWIFEPVAWGTRKTGDDNTNPLPSFVGRTIRGAFFFRNRLGFLAGDSVVLSRAGDYFSFFSATATQTLDTDPIDLSATTADVDTLEWAVVYNQSLLVWSSTRQQFLLTGADVLTPDTAQLKPTTTFESYPRAAPQSLGNRVLFASTLGRYSQLNLYRVAEDTVTNTADDVTAHCPEYVPANPRQLAASSVVKAVVVVPNEASTGLAFFKYELDAQDQLTQKAWSRITLGTPGIVQVMHAHWSSRTLYLLLHVTAPGEPEGGRFYIETLDMDQNAVETPASTPLRLDRRVRVSAGAFDGTNTTLDVPYLAGPQLTLLRGIPGAEPQELETVSAVPNPATLTTRFTIKGDHAGAPIFAGWRFPFLYTFTEPVMRDSDGAPVQSAVVKLKSILVRYVKTGGFFAKVTPFLRETFTYPFIGRNIGQPGQGPNRLALSTGDFSIPVGTNAASTVVSIESDTHLPLNLPYAEWVGSVTMKANR